MKDGVFDAELDPKDCEDAVEASDWPGCTPGNLPLTEDVFRNLKGEIVRGLDDIARARNFT